MYSEKGDTILNPMVGAGTTLIEARLLARNALGLDINPEAVELAKAALRFKHHPASVEPMHAIYHFSAMKCSISC